MWEDSPIGISSGTVSAMKTESEIAWTICLALGAMFMRLAVAAESGRPFTVGLIASGFFLISWQVGLPLFAAALLSVFGTFIGWNEWRRTRI